MDTDPNDSFLQAKDFGLRLATEIRQLRKQNEENIAVIDRLTESNELMQKKNENLFGKLQKSELARDNLEQKCLTLEDLARRLEVSNCFCILTCVLPVDNVESCYR